jgi:hypothetical protein
MAYSCKTKRLPTGTSSGLGVPRGSEPPGSANATNTVAFLITTDKEPGAITVGTRGEKDRSPTGRMAYPTSARKLPRRSTMLTQRVFPFGALTLTNEYEATRDFGSDETFQ